MKSAFSLKKLKASLNQKGFSFFLSWALTYSVFIGFFCFLLQSVNVPWKDFILKRDFISASYLMVRMFIHHTLLALIMSLPILLLSASIFYLRKKRRISLSFLCLLVFAQTLVLIYSFLDSFAFLTNNLRFDSGTLSIFLAGEIEPILDYLIGSGDIKWIFLIFLVFFVCSLFTAGWIWKIKPKLSLKGGGFLAIFIVSLVVSQLIYSFSEAFGYNKITSLNIYLQRPLIQMTFKKVLKKLGVKIHEKQNLELNPSLYALKYPKNPLKFKSSSKKNYNIFFIVVDALRFDMLQKDIMPNFTKFSQENMHFQHHYSSGNTSRNGLFGLFFGVSAYYYWKFREHKIRTVFVNKLLKENYALNLFSYASLFSTDMHQMTFLGLKDHPQFHFDPSFYSIHPRWKRDQEVVKSFIHSLKDKSNKEKSYFGYLFLGSTNAFSIPSSESAKFQPTAPVFKRLKTAYTRDKEPILNLYKNASHFVDALLGEVLKTLKEEGWLKNSVVVVTADHGEEINKMGLGHWGHGANFSDWQIRVPMAIHWPKKPSRKIRAVTSHIDIIPTIFKEIFKCENDISDYSSGKNIFDLDFDAIEKKRHFLVAGWKKKALINGDVVYDLNSTGLKILDPQTYKKKKKGLDTQFLLKTLTHIQGQFL